MSTHALIVDQTSGVRSLFARVLRSLNCVTHEAADGCEALKILQTTEIDLAVFDADSPVLSGLDLLGVLRESDRYAELPVVILTAGSDQNTIAEFVRLGAADCLTRPFDVELIKNRLQRLVKSLSEKGNMQAAPSSSAGARGSALIVDASTEFRHFVADCLTSSYATVQVENGVDALRACQARRFSVLVTGTDTGLLTPRMLAHRLRRQSSLNDTRIVLVLPKGAAREEEDVSSFDAVIHRTFVSEEFTRQFQQLFLAATDGGVVQGVRAAVISATEQVFGMMVQTDVSLVEDSSEPLGTLEAHTVMSIQMARASVKLALRAAVPGAVQMAARMAGTSPEDTSAEAGLPALGEIVNAIADRVKSQVGTDGGSVSFTSPTLIPDAPDTPPSSDSTVLRFASADRMLQVVVELRVAEACETAA